MAYNGYPPQGRQPQYAQRGPAYARGGPQQRPPPPPQQQYDPRYDQYNQGGGDGYEGYEGHDGYYDNGYHDNYNGGYAGYDQYDQYDQWSGQSGWNGQGGYPQEQYQRGQRGGYPPAGPSRGRGTPRQPMPRQPPPQGNPGYGGRGGPAPRGGPQQYADYGQYPERSQDYHQPPQPTGQLPPLRAPSARPDAPVRSYTDPMAVEGRGPTPNVQGKGRRSPPEPLSATSAKPERKPLIEPVSPVSLPQDNAFPTFPTASARKKSGDSHDDLTGRMAGITLPDEMTSPPRQKKSPSKNRSNNPQERMTQQRRFSHDMPQRDIMRGQHPPNAQYENQAGPKAASSSHQQDHHPPRTASRMDHQAGRAVAPDLGVQRSMTMPDENNSAHPPPQNRQQPHLHPLQTQDVRGPPGQGHTFSPVYPPNRPSTSTGHRHSPPKRYSRPATPRNDEWAIGLPGEQTRPKHESLGELYDDYGAPSRPMSYDQQPQHNMRPPPANYEQNYPDQYQHQQSGYDTRDQYGGAQPQNVNAYDRPDRNASLTSGQGPYSQPNHARSHPNLRNAGGAPNLHGIPGDAPAMPVVPRMGSPAVSRDPRGPQYAHDQAGPGYGRSMGPPNNNNAAQPNYRSESRNAYTGLPAGPAGNPRPIAETNVGRSTPVMGGRPGAAGNLVQQQQQARGQTPVPQQQGAPNTKPDSLPYHPMPAKPENSVSPLSNRPPPVRQYNTPSNNTVILTNDSAVSVASTTGTGQQQQPSSRTSLDKRASVPITYDELRRLRWQYQNNPHNHPQALHLAKKLVEAAQILANEGGRADAKTTAKNRETYVLDSHKILKRLVSASYPDAMFYLADQYGTGGLGLQVDSKEAFGLYQSAAKIGHGPSAYRMAVCCELGEGTRQDPMKAVQWYKRAAALGDTAAMYKMGMILLNGLLGQQRNMGEAVNMLKRAAEGADEQNPHALHQLGMLYETAAPSSRLVADDNYAFELYERAARLGYKFSQARLGRVYEFGELNRPIDQRASIAWYTRAAAQAEHESEFRLSGWYLTGAQGVLEQSDTEAYLWARKAATSEPPLPQAMFAMGYYTEVGIGCPRSLDEAKRWYGRAAAYRYTKAQQRLEELKKGGVKAQKNRERLSRTNQNEHEESCAVM